MDEITEKKKEGITAQEEIIDFKSVISHLLFQ